MALTYEPISTTTSSGTTTSITFSSISGSYTDLILVMNTTPSNVTSFIGMRFNGDTGSNYSATRLYGNGTSATSDRNTNGTSAQVGTVRESGINTTICNINNYSNSTTNKTIISRDSVVDFRVGALVSLWRSTAAITSITLICPDASGFGSGSTFTLYGIKAA